MSSTIFQTPVLIPKGSSYLVGTLYRNVEDPAFQQPGVAISGSWLTVKEQMSHIYALELAARGFTVLTFDFEGWGQSRGALPFTEQPLVKSADIVAATSFLSSLGMVTGNKVNYLAICASAMYVVAAIDQGAPISAFASVAGWFHDPQTVGVYYGGPDGIRKRLDRAILAVKRHLESGELSQVPAFESGNEIAGMFLPLDYYADTQRGRIAPWPNQMSELTWLYWLTFDGISSATRLTVPTLFVHGDECALPDNARHVHDIMPGAKELVWNPGFQTDYYDRPDLVQLASDAAATHFERYEGAAQ